jgi:hypothetical protein
MPPGISPIAVGINNNNYPRCLRGCYRTLWLLHCPGFKSSYMLTKILTSSFRWIPGQHASYHAILAAFLDCPLVILPPGATLFGSIVKYAICTKTSKFDTTSCCRGHCSLPSQFITNLTKSAINANVLNCSRTITRNTQAHLLQSITTKITWSVCYVLLKAVQGGHSFCQSLWREQRRQIDVAASGN